MKRLTNALIILTFAAASLDAIADTPSQIDTAVANAYGWLDGQYLAGCVQSYKNDFNDQYTIENGVYKLVVPRAPDDRGYTYDQALAVIAYLQDPRPDNNSGTKAREILSRLKASQNAEGSWYTAYTCSTSSTNGAVAEPFTDVGPTAWVGLAALAYKARNPVDTTYDDMIVAIARYVSNIQWKTQWGGDGAVNFASNRLQWVASTEHNIDLYAFLKGIKANSALYARANASLAGDYSIDSTLDNIYGFLTNNVWNQAELHFNGGRNDGKFPTDMLTFGSASMGDDFNNAYYSLVRWAVETVPSPFEYNGVVDFVHSRERANQGTYFNAWYDYFSASSGSNGDLVIVNDKLQDAWYEGTGQMVVALKMAKAFYAGLGWGTEAIQGKIDQTLGNLMARQHEDGGLIYSDRGSSNTYFRMKTASAVAATTWLIFAARGFNCFYPFARTY
ncbi:hypothetical protein BJN34_11230 [Cupriavidus necator]|uniref:Uncharacterized protein n=1 Tax=Cupriavidus necator TaxID=106590 RepID=A0A1U9UPD0_CUPNE|nr:hypothetical protein [Cupriavidus necator]AQV94460.1 hypothetical protein BJN34_11230 [Cupriavidus necator]